VPTSNSTWRRDRGQQPDALSRRFRHLSDLTVAASWTAGWLLSLLGADDSRRRGSPVPSSYRADPPRARRPPARARRVPLSRPHPDSRVMFSSSPDSLLFRARLAAAGRGIAGCRGCIGGVSAPRRVSILARRLRRRLHLRHAPLLAFHPLPSSACGGGSGAVPPSPSTPPRSWASFASSSPSPPGRR
jgi:hypothetical protein